MQTISNNLANVNTVGFKAMRTNYEDLISQAYYSSGNLNQIGCGAKVNTLQSMFTQGAFRTADQETDLAIAGEGFFNVRHRVTGETMYTRAGVYTLNKDGYMEDPSGNILQGWRMSVPQPGQEAVRLGDPTDIKVASLIIPPEATTNIKAAVNLNADDQSAYFYPAQQEGGPGEGAGYAGAWNGAASPGLDVGAYTYSEPLTVYDAAGNQHTLMTYYQKNPHMENVWDYIITCDPGEDARRDQSGQLLLADQATFAGLIQKGKITFTADGEEGLSGGLIKDLEAQNLDLSRSLAAYADPPAPQSGASDPMRTAVIGGYYTGSPGLDPATGLEVSSPRAYTVSWGYKDPSTGLWQAADNSNPPRAGLTWEDDQGQSGFIPVSDLSYPGPYAFGSGLTITFDNQSGLPMTFGLPGADAVTVTAHSEQRVWGEASPNSDGYFDFDLTFAQSAAMLDNPPYPADLATVSQKVSLNMGAKNPFGAGAWQLEEIGTTQFAGQSSTTFKAGNGYPEGSLQRLSVSEDGMISGVYSNGRQEALFQIALTRFRNPWGLSKQGDNLFAKTGESGGGLTLVPGQDGAGEVLGNFLEQSNVDVAAEIVNMIVTQRGFQANSKTITTKDAMLATAIQTKK
jgi:flagellar hook protein FlgE